MERINKPNISQEKRILEVLQKYQGNWVNGQVFGRTMMISQYHRAIHNLQKRKSFYEYSGDIEASDFTDSFGFKMYRLRPEPKQQASLFNKVDAYEEITRRLLES